MESFEGGSGNPEKPKKLGLGKRLRLAAAAVGIAAFGATTNVSPKVDIPNEIRTGEPPKPGEIPVPKPSTPQGLKNT